MNDSYFSFIIKLSTLLKDDLGINYDDFDLKSADVIRISFFMILISNEIQKLEGTEEEKKAKMRSKVARIQTDFETIVN